MKYSANLIKKTMSAIDNHPLHSFWNIHKTGQYDDIEICEIRFENLDNVQMNINISKNEVNAIVYTDDECKKFKWLGSCNLDKITGDQYMMWLGIKLDQMYRLADDIAENS